MIDLNNRMQQYEMNDVQVEQADNSETLEFLVIFGKENYPNVDPVINSACELMISAINSSLKASCALRHFLPPGKTRGRSFGVLGPLLGFITLELFNTFSVITNCKET